MIKHEYISSDLMDTYYKSIIQKMAKDGYKPDVVIGLVRGGADMAAKFSHYFDVPCEMIKWQMRDGTHGNPVPEAESGKLMTILTRAEWKHGNILFVDDICDSGKSLEMIEEQIKAMTFLGNITYAVCIENIDNDMEIDYSARQISRNVDEQWFVFPCESWWL